MDWACYTKELFSNSLATRSTIFKQKYHYYYKNEDCHLVIAINNHVLASNGMMKSKRLSSVSVINVNILTKICKHQE